MQIAPAACRRSKKNYFVRFILSAGPSLDTENTLLALGQDKAMHRGVAIASYPFSSFFFFFSPFQELSNFLYISLEGNSSNVASFRFISFSFPSLFCRDNGAVGNLASLFCNLRKQPFAARVLVLIFSYGRFRCLKKRSFVNFYGRRSLLIVRIIFLLV